MRHSPSCRTREGWRNPCCRNLVHRMSQMLWSRIGSGYSSGLLITLHCGSSSSMRWTEHCRGAGNVETRHPLDLNTCNASSGTSNEQAKNFGLTRRSQDSKSATPCWTWGPTSIYCHERHGRFLEGHGSPTPQSNSGWRTSTAFCQSADSRASRLMLRG